MKKTLNAIATYFRALADQIEVTGIGDGQNWVEEISLVSGEKDTVSVNEEGQQVLTPHPAQFKVTFVDRTEADDGPSQIVNDMELLQMALHMNYIDDLYGSIEASFMPDMPDMPEPIKGDPIGFTHVDEVTTNNGAPGIDHFKWLEDHPILKAFLSPLDNPCAIDNPIGNLDAPPPAKHVEFLRAIEGKSDAVRKFCEERGLKWTEVGISEEGFDGDPRDEVKALLNVTDEEAGNILRKLAYALQEEEEETNEEIDARITAMIEEKSKGYHQILSLDHLSEEDFRPLSIATEDGTDLRWPKWMPTASNIRDGHLPERGVLELTGYEEATKEVQRIARFMVVIWVIPNGPRMSSEWCAICKDMDPKDWQGI